MKFIDYISFKNSLTTVFVFIIITFAACDVLEKEPLDSLYQEEIWRETGFINMYLNDIYLDLLPKFGAAENEGLSDETAYIFDYSPELVRKLIYGELIKDDVNYLGRDFYAKIAKINRLFKDIETSKIEIGDKQIIKAQAYFLRAYAYWEQVKLQGGIPMVMEKLEPVINGELQVEALYLERNKTGECINLIIQDLDTAFKYLPAVWEKPDVNYGRITRGAALALKGRILLFWASPQFNPYNKVERWQRAYEANKTALEILEQDGYGLNPSFIELFHDCNERTKEAIFVRVYNTTAFSHNYDAKARPALAGVGGQGFTNNPTWEMVQAFPMSDGFPIGDNTGSYTYDTSLYWKNRDPRFEYTIAYNGGIWPLSGIENYKIWTYYILADKSNDYIIPNNNKLKNHNSKTGFFCKKFINPKLEVKSLSTVGTDWMEIRFAEVLLNFAECANEVGGKSVEAREALNRIRNERTDVKAGMGYIDKHLNDKVIMREIIMTERQIELAFENKRYFDLRRRNMFSEDLGPNIKKLNNTTRSEYRIILNEISTTAFEMALIRDGLDFNNIRQYNNSFVRRYPYNLDTYSPINYPQPKYNFLPIQRDNIEKNPNFKQTIYWEGSFDPLAE
ncbi:MAG: RagB/SusD family nutrient uptake outer membrane protein [Bacteroidales bacterium]